MFQNSNRLSVNDSAVVTSNTRRVNIFVNLAVSLASLSDVPEGWKRQSWGMTRVRRESQMHPGTALKLAKARLKRPHHFSRQSALTHNANFKSALLIQTQANGAFGICLEASILDGLGGPKPLAGIRALSMITRLSPRTVGRCSLCRRFAFRDGWPSRI